MFLSHTNNERYIYVENLQMAFNMVHQSAPLLFDLSSTFEMRGQDLKRRLAVCDGPLLQELEEIDGGVQGLLGLLQVVVIGNLDAHQLADAVRSGHQVVHLALGEFPPEVVGHVLDD